MACDCLPDLSSYNLTGAIVDAGDMSPRMEMCVRYRMLQKQNVTAFRRFLEAVTREANKA